MWFNTEPRRANPNNATNESNRPTNFNVTQSSTGDPPSIGPLGGGTQPTKNKRIVLCFDGTDDSYSDLNSNVVDFFSLLSKEDVTEQVCYYQPGIGTYENGTMWSTMTVWWSKIMDEAFAWYLPAHVMQGYQFLMQNYTAGDKVFLFGFSRGAYTARALAGMLHKIGLLPKDNTQQIPFAFSMYTDVSKTGIQEAAGFKQTFCRSISIDFLGVWDTVASVGIIMSRNLPFSNSTDSIRVFRHALSLDEHRVRFIPTLWSPNPDKTDDVSPADSVIEKKKKANSVKHWLRKNAHLVSGVGGVVSDGSEEDRQNKEKSANPDETGTTAGDGNIDGPPLSGSTNTSETDVLEVWFSGCHTDIGGGSVSDSTPHALDHITLRWMVRQIIITSTDILLDPAALERLNLQDIVTSAEAGATGTTGATSQATPVSSTVACPTELQLDSADALARIHDELVLEKLWWILEYLPMKYAPREGMKSVVGLHRGRGRVVRGKTPNIHVTVQERMKDGKLHYKPKATWTGTPNWVE